MSNLSNTVSHPPPLTFSVPVKIQTVKQNKTKQKTCNGLCKNLKQVKEKQFLVYRTVRLHII